MRPNNVPTIFSNVKLCNALITPQFVTFSFLSISHDSISADANSVRIKLLMKLNFIRCKVIMMLEWNCCHC